MVSRRRFVKGAAAPAAWLVGFRGAFAAGESAAAKAFLPLVRANSAIGFESSNHYFYLPRDVVEKILCCRSILEKLENVKTKGMTK